MSGDLDQEAAEVVKREALLNQSWIWHLPHSQAEAFVLGTAAASYCLGLVAAVAVPAWPWWIRVGALVLVGPWLLVAWLMAARAWWTGVGGARAVAAGLPLLLWLSLIGAVHTVPIRSPWLALPAYSATVVITVLLWRRWTAQTHVLRRKIRWRREDGTPWC